MTLDEHMRIHMEHTDAYYGDPVLPVPTSKPKRDFGPLIGLLIVIASAATTFGVAWMLIN